MRFREVKPLPKRCRKCPEAKEGKKMGLTEDAYCYNCDYALERWEIIEDEDDDEENEPKKRSLLIFLKKFGKIFM